MIGHYGILGKLGGAVESDNQDDREASWVNFG
jgi:hypothetical protein